MFRSFDIFGKASVEVHTDQLKGSARRVMVSFADRTFATPDNGINGNAVASPEVFHFGTGFDNLRGKFVALDQRKTGSRMKLPLENMLITATNTSLTELHQHLITGYLGRGDFFPYHFSVFLKNGCFHGVYFFQK